MPSWSKLNKEILRKKVQSQGLDIYDLKEID